MLTAKTFEIRNSLWIFFEVTPKQRAKPNLRVTWQIIKHKLPLLPYFQATILYDVFAGRISLPGLEWIYQLFLTFIVGFVLLKDLHLCRHQQWLLCSIFIFVLTCICLRLCLFRTTLRFSRTEPSDCDVMTRFDASRYVSLVTRYVSTCVGAGSRKGWGKKE
jgi:hypothetical protein